MTYDKKCYELALAFLSDDSGSLPVNERDRHADALAQRIQGAIEDYLQEEGL